MNIPKIDLKRQTITLEKLKESYYDLRLDLCSVIDNIEEASPTLTLTPRMIRKETTHPIVMNRPDSSISQKIRHYRVLIRDLRKKLESINVLEKVNHQEELIKGKEVKVSSLESENKTLKLIYNNQTKGLLQFKTNAKLNDDLLINGNKIIKFKEDIQLKKQVHSDQLVTIKNQLSHIDVIQKKNNKIIENIAYKGKQDLIHKKEIIMSNTANSCVNDIIKRKIDIREMVSQIETNEFKLTKDKVKYLRMIRFQKDKISQITQEINLLSNQINQLNQIKRLQERGEKKQRYYIQRLNHFQIQSNKFTNQDVDANGGNCNRSANHNCNGNVDEKNEKLKSRNNYYSLKNNSQSARNNEEYYPKILRSNKKGIKKNKKVLEINQLMSLNNQSVQDNNKMIYQNNLLQEIESLSKSDYVFYIHLEDNLSLAIENDVFVNKKFNKFFKEKK